MASGKFVDVVKLNGVWGALRWTESLDFLEFDVAPKNTRAAAAKVAAGLEHDYGDKPGEVTFER